MPRDEPPDTLTGFVCPRCGGALWERPGDGERSEDGPTRFRCRIGDAFSETRLWIEHCAARNKALLAAARSLA